LAAQRLTGSGPLSYLVPRYGLIAAPGILFYAAALRTVAGAALAASFSFRSFCSTGSAGRCIIASRTPSHFWPRASRRGSPRLPWPDEPTRLRAIALGLIIDLGIMAKWSFRVAPLTQ
jgi:hypothetical protein